MECIGKGNFGKIYILDDTTVRKISKYNNRSEADAYRKVKTIVDEYKLFIDVPKVYNQRGKYMDMDRIYNLEHIETDYSYFYDLGFVQAKMIFKYDMVLWELELVSGNLFNDKKKVFMVDFDKTGYIIDKEKMIAKLKKDEFPVHYFLVHDANPSPDNEHYNKFKVGFLEGSNNKKKAQHVLDQLFELYDSQDDPLSRNTK